MSCRSNNCFVAVCNGKAIIISFQYDVSPEASNAFVAAS